MRTINIKALLMQVVALLSLALKTDRNDRTEVEKLRTENTKLQGQLNEALANEGNLTDDERESINGVVAEAAAALPPQDHHIEEMSELVSANAEEVGPAPAPPLTAATGQSPAAAGLPTPSATDGSGISDPVTTGGADPTNVKREDEPPKDRNESLEQGSPEVPAPGDKANAGGK